MKVRFTPFARQQFLGLMDYIKRDKPTAALLFRRRVERCLRRLERFPQSGRSIPEFPDLPYREVMVPPYRFFYRAKGKTVWIVGAPALRTPPPPSPGSDPTDNAHRAASDRCPRPKPSSRATSGSSRCAGRSRPR